MMVICINYDKVNRLSLTKGFSVDVFAMFQDDFLSNTVFYRLFDLLDDLGVVGKGLILPNFVDFPAFG